MSANELSDDELREIADEARDWSACATAWKQGRHVARGYEQGLIAGITKERLRHRAEGEGCADVPASEERDGIAGSTFVGLFYKLEEVSRALRIGDCEGAEMYLEDARTLINGVNGSTRRSDGLARRLAVALELVAARLAARTPADAPTAKSLREQWRRDVDVTFLGGASDLLDEARAQGLLDGPPNATAVTKKRMCGCGDCCNEATIGNLCRPCYRAACNMGGACRVIAGVSK